MREFESLHLRINVRAQNEAELFYDASARPRGEDEISLHITLNRYAADAEIGRQIIRVFDSCAHWTT